MRVHRKTNEITSSTTRPVEAGTATGLPAADRPVVDRPVGRRDTVMAGCQGRLAVWRSVVVAVVAMAGVVIVTSPSANAHQNSDLRIDIGLAPVAPDGLTAGAPTDFIVGFEDIDPNVAGVGLKAGGTVRITLPNEFVNTGDRPVTGDVTMPGCGPPLVSSCSTAVILQGWPQSVQPPFPGVHWDEATNTIVLTANADWIPIDSAAPGPKTVHLQLLGFTNPAQPGSYRLDVEIQPDPNEAHVLTGHGKASIRHQIKANVSSVSLANGSPPPPFPNTLFQDIESGDPSLTMMLYLWARDLVPLVGASFENGPQGHRLIVDADGKPIGQVVVRAPHPARNWSLDSFGPAEAASAFITGYDTAVMRAVLHTDPAVSGTFLVTFRLFGGNSTTHRINTE